MGSKRLLTVARQDPAGLLPFLIARLGVPEAEAERLLRQGAVYVDRRRVVLEKAGEVRPGTRVTVYLPGPDPGAPGGGSGERAAAEAPEIVLLDEDLLVLCKPAGLPSQPGPGGGPSVLSWLAEQGHAGVHLVHRLDRDASGLLLCARHGGVCARLQGDLGQGAIERKYLAVVLGQLAPEGRVDLRIAHDRRDRTRRVALPAGAPGGQPATTYYRLERTLSGDRSLIELVLGTGRTHQIRVHMQAIGHPILGDRLYGGPRAPGEEDPPRLMLHAASLRFPHPTTGAPVELSAPAPPAFFS